MVEGVNVVLLQLALQVFLLSVVEGVNVVLLQLALQVFLLSVVEGVKRCPTPTCLTGFLVVCG